MSLETSKSASARQSRVASRARAEKNHLFGIDLVHDGFDHAPEERVVYLRHGSELLLKSEKPQTGDALL